MPNQIDSYFHPDMTVSELLDRWPQTISVFFQLHAGCVGCDMASFDTLADVATNYHIPIDELIQKISLAILPPQA